MTGPWVAPDATTSPPTRAAAVAPTPTVDTPASADDRSGPVAPPVPLRPMTVPDLLDGAFAIIKRRPRDVLLIAAAFVLPVQVVSVLLLRDVLGQSAFGGDGGLFDVNESGEVVGAGDAIASFAVSAVSLALLAGALGLLVDAWYRGESPTPGSVVVATLRRSPALVVGVVLVHLLEAAGLIAIGIGAYVAMALLHVVAPVTTVESVGPLRAIRRSVQLTTRRWGTSLGVPALVGLIGLLVSFGFQLVPEVVAAFTPGDWDWLVRAAGGLASELVIAPFTAGVAVLYHLDLRIRTEGIDLERRAHELFAS